MSNLKTGQVLTVEGLAGTWSVWSQAAEAAAAFFLVPFDDTARNTGIKYAVIKATQKKTEAKPDLTLIRTEHRSNA